MTLEEIIKQRLAEATAHLEAATVTEAAACGTKKQEATALNPEDEVIVSPKKKVTVTKESLDEMTPEQVSAIDVEQLDEVSKATLAAYCKKAEPAEKMTKESVSSQVTALLEAEGLSDDFKLQAVTIFEAAVTDRILQIEENMEKEFDEQLAEAVAEIESDIDGFVNDAILEWKQTNEVAIKQNFKTHMNESFVDGLMSLLAEHNIDITPGKEDALEVALKEVTKLEESVKEADAEKQELQEQINQLKASKILESFSSKMTQTEFDRFTQLTESINYVSETQYTKQLSIVLENFSVFKAPAPTQIVEDTTTKALPVEVVIESNSNVAQYAKFIKSKKI